VPAWCQPGEQVFVTVTARAWSTLADSPAHNPTWLDHGTGTCHLTSLQTVVFLATPGDVLCVPHWMTLETGIRHGNLDISMIGSHFARLRLPEPQAFQNLLDQLRDHAQKHRTEPAP